MALKAPVPEPATAVLLLATVGFCCVA
ncbi:MAG: PEP-CTERM sorting domain-containing protein [Bacteroidales bacterium]|nr:PEP-CTERM sorting domain-containing protein [Bacteroidales bacterium]